MKPCCDWKFQFSRLAARGVGFGYRLLVCVYCPTNARLLQRYSRGSLQVCMHTYSWFVILNRAKFLCVLFSQMPGLGGAILSGPLILAPLFSWFVLFSNVFPSFFFQFTQRCFLLIFDIKAMLLCTCCCILRVFRWQPQKKRQLSFYPCLVTQLRSLGQNGNSVTFCLHSLTHLTVAPPLRPSSIVLGSWDFLVQVSWRFALEQWQKPFSQLTFLICILI